MWQQGVHATATEPRRKKTHTHTQALHPQGPLMWGNTASSPVTEQLGGLGDTQFGGTGGAERPQAILLAQCVWKRFQFHHIRFTTIV